MIFTDLNCNLRGECVMLLKKTAPICRRGCSNIAGGYIGSFSIPMIAPGGLKFNRF